MSYAGRTFACVWLAMPWCIGGTDAQKRLIVVQEQYLEVKVLGILLTCCDSCDWEVWSVC